MSDLQRDIEQVEWVMSERTDDEPWAAWQRLKLRLTPDRERVARAIGDTDLAEGEAWRFYLPHADAAIAAMQEGTP